MRTLWVRVGPPRKERKAPPAPVRLELVRVKPSRMQKFWVEPEVRTAERLLRMPSMMVTKRSGSCWVKSAEQHGAAGEPDVLGVGAGGGADLRGQQRQVEVGAHGRDDGGVEGGLGGGGGGA